jgi:hypothetical protein
MTCPYNFPIVEIFIIKKGLFNPRPKRLAGKCVIIGLLFGSHPLPYQHKNCIKCGEDH